MKKFTKVLFASAAIFGFSAVSAQAADFEAPPAVYDWSGPYFGIQFGGAVDGDADSLVPAIDADPDGVLGGIMSGYNFQFDNIVVGIDSDFSVTDIEDTVAPGIGGDIDTLSTTRGRIGYAMDNILFYATGGVAYGFVDVFAPGFSDEEFNVGWTAGGGIEYGITDRIRARIQYTFVDLGSDTYDIPGPVVVDVSELHIVRGGVAIDTGFVLDAILGR